MSYQPCTTPETDTSLTLLEKYLRHSSYSRFFVLMDDNVRYHCFNYLLEHCPSLQEIATETIPHGEGRKNLATCEQVYEALMHQQADRDTLFICLGGGMITDLGGLIAGTYKRGIAYINVPTTFLGMVDAAIGGKTGVNFHGAKNMVGLFNQPKRIFLHPAFIQTLDDRQWLNGYAELLKHALIADDSLWQALKHHDNPRQLEPIELIQKGSAIKQQIVDEDEREAGRRKVLNFGHTAGHAIESYFLQSDDPMLHGEAIAAGMICEAFMSSVELALEADELNEIITTLSSIYPLRPIPEDAYLSLLEWMRQDKKNSADAFRFTLLTSIGNARYDVDCDENLITDALDYYNALLAKET